MSLSTRPLGLPMESNWKVLMVSHMRCRTRSTSAATAAREASAATCHPKAPLIKVRVDRALQKALTVVKPCHDEYLHQAPMDVGGRAVTPNLQLSRECLYFEVRRVKNFPKMPTLKHYLQLSVLNWSETCKALSEAAPQESSGRAEAGLNTGARMLAAENRWAADLVALVKGSSFLCSCGLRGLSHLLPLQVRLFKGSCTPTQNFKRSGDARRQHDGNGRYPRHASNPE